MSLGTVRQQIDWLNATVFQNRLIADKIEEAAAYVDSEKVFAVLKQVEEKKGEVSDPNAWVCAALRKVPGIDNKIRTRVDWLNTQGGFQNSIIFEKVCEAAKGVQTVQVLGKLKDLEDNKESVQDPTAYVTKALRNAAARNINPYNPGSQNPFNRGSQMVPLAKSFNIVSGDDDAKLRKRIGWLNGQGGFAGNVNYTKVLAAGGSLGIAKIMEVLKQLEEHGETVRDPTGWVVVALQKAANKAYGGAVEVSSMPGRQSSGAMGGAASLHLAAGPGPTPPAGLMEGTSTDQILRKAVGWLNRDGGFGGSIIYEKVAESAAGIDAATLTQCFEDLVANRQKVRDPTAYVTKALRNAGGGAALGGGKYPTPTFGGAIGVKRTIMMTRPMI